MTHTLLVHTIRAKIANLVENSGSDEVEKREELIEVVLNRSASEEKTTRDVERDQLKEIGFSYTSGAELIDKTYDS